MESLPKIINQYPELLSITKPSLKNGIFYNVDFNIVEALISIYKFYFEKNVILFIPKNCNNCNNCKSDIQGIEVDIESIENYKPKESDIVLFVHSDIIFNSLYNNKRRLNTILKNISKKCKTIVLSITDLKKLNLQVFESFQKFDLKSNNTFMDKINLFDLVDNDQDNFESNVDSLVDIVKGFENKSVYISLYLPINKIVFIETKLKENEIEVSRKETGNGVVLNASKTTQRNFLKREYQIYIYVFPEFDGPLGIYNYFKDVLHESVEEIYIDSSNWNQVEESMDSKVEESIVAKDSVEFENLKEINIENMIFASDNYYQFEASEPIRNMDISNLTKKEYDTIRNFIKLKLNNKFDLDIRTCQLSTPSSPKDRSRKINSLSNKISSIDYRCDISCEIFKDFTIGVVIWNEMWNSKEKLNCLKNEVYIYQTTTGKWKYTSLI